MATVSRGFQSSTVHRKPLVYVKERCAFPAMKSCPVRNREDFIPGVCTPVEQTVEHPFADKLLSKHLLRPPTVSRANHVTVLEELETLTPPLARSKALGLTRGTV